jgi:hypothetical protein
VKSQPPPPATPTGIKPLEQLAQKHRQQKQEQAQKLIGATPTSPPSAPTFTIAMFIHMVATALAKAPETMHTREIERLQNFWKTHQPLRADTVGIAMAKAILTHGNNQHIDVYLHAIKALHLKWQNSSSDSANPAGRSPSS